MSRLWPLALLLTTASMQAQSDGTVTGHVYCADTQKPARFVPMRLQPVDAAHARMGGSGFATTGADGSFRMEHVAPGDYYADVTMPGYVQPLRGILIDSASLSESDRDRLYAQLTRISVSANQTTTAQISIVRGATIEGTVSFDDGPPAVGVSLQALRLQPSASGTVISPTQQTIFAGFARSDDRGVYRLTGLPEGSYIVRVSAGLTFPTYYGNTIDRGRAKRIEVHGSDDATGTDIQVAVAYTHRVSGVVQSSQDGHGLAHALVPLRLSSGDDNSISVISGADGSFVFPAVPDGSFKLTLSNMFSDTGTQTGYSSNGQAVDVNGADVTDLVVNATPRGN